MLSIGLPEKYDIHLFKDLPLFLKAEVLEHGKLLYVKNKKEFYLYIMKIKRILEDEEIRIKN